MWNYDRWDPELFKGYVNTFVGLKQQASGWPENCDSQEARNRYIAEFDRVEGIRMDPAKVEINAGLRMIAVGYNKILNEIYIFLENIGKFFVGKTGSTCGDNRS